MSLYSEIGTYKRPVEIRRTGIALSFDALEIRSRPREISVSLEKQTVRSLSVLPNLTGFPATGYELTQYFVSPSSVTAIGPDSQMASLSELTTELIDLSNRRANFSQSTRIVIPSSQIEIPGGTAVEFRGIVEESIIIRTMEDMTLVVFDIPGNLKIEGELPRASITLQGNQLAIEDIRPQDVILYIDGSTVHTPGDYTFTGIYGHPFRLCHSRDQSQECADNGDQCRIRQRRNKLIVGIGMDIVSTHRIRHWLDNPGLCERYFHPEEIATVLKRGKAAPQALAARFAAKEAFVKAMGTGLTGMRLYDIRVTNKANGQPELILDGHARKTDGQ